jgi:hypothetical protein
LNRVIEAERFTEINFMVDELSNLQNTSSEVDMENINLIVNLICDLFDSTATNSFGTVRPTQSNRSVNRPWFDVICKHKRQEFHTARKIYNRFKSETNRIRLSEASKAYKFAMNKSFEKYQDKITCDIRNSAKLDPKKFWNILNRCSEKSRQSVDVSLDELYNYFKEMNEVENEDIEIVTNLNENNHDDVLNAPISQDEIENAILILHNDKAS